MTASENLIINISNQLEGGLPSTTEDQNSQQTEGVAAQDMGCSPMDTQIDSQSAEVSTDDEVFEDV